MMTVENLVFFSKIFDWKKTSQSSFQLQSKIAIWSEKWMGFFALFQ